MAECDLKPCRDKGSPIIQLGRKAIETIIKCSEIRMDGVKEKLLVDASFKAHSKCRQLYILRPQHPNQDPGPSVKIPRLTFDFKSLCFLCCRKCTDMSKSRNPVQENWSLVTKLDFVDTIRATADNRNDCWGNEVRLRMTQVIDLVGSDGRYHKYCLQRFLKHGALKPGIGAASKGGSSCDVDRQVGFQKICDYLEENDECQFTFDELKSKFVELNPNLDPYSDIHFKRKLVQRYGSSLQFAELPGKKTVLTFTGTASNILSDFWYKTRNMNDEAQEEIRVLKAAAAIIRREIKSRVYNCSQFPTVDEITNGGTELVPELLKLLISEIIKPTCIRQSPEKMAEKTKIMDRKTTTICQNIISAVRPRSFVSPVQLGIGVCLHRKFGSRILIDLLSNVGVCVPYSEVLKYERSVTIQNDIRIENGYVQFVFDNADYNVNTVDGHNTFHVMGGICCVTPNTALQLEENIPRMNIAASAVEYRGQFEVVPYRAPGTCGYSQIIVSDMTSLKLVTASSEQARTLNFFWLSGAWLEGPANCKPGWSGCMEMLFAQKQYQTSSVIPLPLINLAPSNPSTIYTALIQAAERGARNQQSITMVTFDQPLYAKAREMVAAASDDSSLKSLFIRLGGFHLLMSFLSAIGYIMAGSGLEELLCTVYAKNSVPQMMNGKAYARIIRALYLVEEALITVILQTSDDFTGLDKDELKDIYFTLKSGSALPENNIEFSAVKNFVQRLERELQRLKASGRTQKLWVQFIEMVELVRTFVRAERSGDFHLHLHCVHQMLPIFHAAGHFNYAKSAHVYLQDSVKLLTALNPSEYESFVTQGYFTIRRSEKFWSGVWSDMTIEQVLMRSMSSTGGLTRGRGITATTTATWINSMPTCSRVVEGIEKFSGVRGGSSEQHLELREANQKRNSKDLLTFISWLEEHNPFSKPHELSSLSTGVVADKNVNCDEAFEVGKAALQEIENKKFSDIHFKRKLTVKSLASITKSVRIFDDTVCVNPNTLLHRMVSTVRSNAKLAEIFTYELCSYPPSLFDECGLMRKGSKSKMVTILVPEESEPSCDTLDPEKTSFVIDGGHLLHRVVWQRPANFQQICQQYTGYVIAHYGKSTIVFDGYERNSTKDEEHLRRSQIKTLIEVKVEDAINVTLNQNEFLSNVKNKIELISLLTVHLRRAGCSVHQAEGDADLPIVFTAIKEAEKGHRVTVIGDDTDLLVLLIVHAPEQNNLKMVVPKKGNMKEKVYFIRDIQLSLGDMKDVLLAVYAFTGCDTVSAIYKRGKITPFKKVQANKALQSKLLTFNDPGANPQDVADAGKHFFLSMFGGNHPDNLDNVRYQSYLKLIAKQPVHSMIKLAALPPTSASAIQHSFRAYHQVQQWLNNPKDPLEWGWKKIDNHLRPVTSLLPAAPRDLLSLIVCKCKDECVRKCECKISGLHCSDMCRNCTGIGCFNRDPLLENIIEEDDLEEEQ